VGRDNSIDPRDDTTLGKHEIFQATPLRRRERHPIHVDPDFVIVDLAPPAPATRQRYQIHMDPDYAAVDHGQPSPHRSQMGRQSYGATLAQGDIPDRAGLRS